MLDDAGKVLDALKNPWDWVAGFIGGGAGAVTTVFLHGADMGHSIPTGALTAIGARRAAVASFQRPALAKKAKSLEAFLKRDGSSDDLAGWLAMERAKWEQKITSNELFAKRLDEISDLDSKRRRDHFLPAP